MDLFRDSKAHARADQLTRRIEVLEVLVARLASQAGVSAEELEMADSGLTPEVRRLVGEGQHLQAIRKYMRSTGAGLAEAKRAVEAYAVRGHSD